MGPGRQMGANPEEMHCGPPPEGAGAGPLPPAGIFTVAQVHQRTFVARSLQNAGGGVRRPKIGPSGHCR